MVVITIVRWGYKPTNITRGPHIVSPVINLSITSPSMASKPEAFFYPLWKRPAMMLDDSPLSNMVNCYILQWKDPPFLMGKYPLFPLGHFQLQTVSSPEGTNMVNSIAMSAFPEHPVTKNPGCLNIGTVFLAFGKLPHP